MSPYPPLPSCNLAPPQPLGAPPLPMPVPTPTPLLGQITSTPSIKITTENTIEMVIQDEGCGINTEDLPHIFERFYKQRSEENKTGTGLGLAIVQQIADRHGIKIEVISSPNEGAEFRFIFQSD